MAELHITAACKYDRTYLKNSFCTHPFKIGNVTEDKSKVLLKLMIMSSSPGVLDNDQYNIKIELEEDAQLQLSTQGYQRYFTMVNGAKQTMNIHLKNNASFTWLPHPNVPHRLSKFKGINNIYLHGDHNLLWSEIITAGRKSCDEEFMFSYFRNTTNIFIEDKLVVKENVLLEPAKRNITAVGQLEGYTHHSTLLFLNNAIDIELIMDECYKFLNTTRGIEFGISELPVNGFSVRMLGNKGEQLFEIHQQLSKIISRQTEVITINA